MFKNRLPLISAYIFICCLFCIINLIIGSNPIYIIYSVLALIIFGIVLLIFENSLLKWFSILVLAQYSFFPLLLKAALFQRLEDGFINPDKVFITSITASLIVLFALILTKHFSKYRPVLALADQNGSRLFFGISTYLVGISLTLINLIIKPVILSTGEVINGFGGLGEFSGFIYLGIICICAYFPESERYRKIKKNTLIIMVLGALLMSLIGNVKIYFTLALLSTFLAAIILENKFSFKNFAIFSIIFAFFIFVIVPIIHGTRTDSFRTASFSKKFQLVVDEMFQSGNNRIDTTIKNSDTYDSIVHSPIGDRLDMLQDVDLVIGKINASNKLGWEPVNLALKSILPSLIIKNKPFYTDEDLVVYITGYTKELRPIRHTIGLFTISSAMFSYPWSIIFSFLLVILFYIILTRIVSNKLNNVYSLYFLIKYGFLFSEVGVESLLLMCFRSMIVDIVIIFLLKILVNKVNTPRRRLISNTVQATYIK